MNNKDNSVLLYSCIFTLIKCIHAILCNVFKNKQLLESAD